MTDPSTHTDNAYESLAEADDDARWAYGTGFDDPLAGVDTSLPAGVDGTALAAYCLMLADDALIMSQRLAEWSTNAPELEEEVALANIGLDLLGQARLLLARAAAADAPCVPALPDGSPVPAEDALTYFRDEREFRNVRLVEAANGDFAASTARLFCFSAWRLGILQRLRESSDPVLAAVAAKGVKELTYHRDYAARWLVTLAQGTDESRRRMVDGLARSWPYVGELFDTHPVESSLAGTAVDPTDVRAEFDDALATVLGAAALERPDAPFAQSVGGKAGRDGVHTETMGHLLAEMQSVARAHPMGTW
ncbi:1,2-phenylacetyl-CoA epoxidase subunit PaaC [Solicola gregarius]|uniref:Phenylacetate-CoA oxygenase subunit PaaC n=1 Tax=Solicola gregarius TaxID=2908642 RepID=A0AA46TKD0_9ACTN|nr:1,2-phenylacetyl-CoA epoxidase subunit PaaC [Solicola gregarius]UYM06482.1 phenylacetate-CoA oxygenase subunit PaaC [Solicola gregarius]